MRMGTVYWAALASLVGLAGWAWLCGAAATGQRFPGPSFSFAIPAATGVLAAGAALGVIAAIARRLGDARWPEGVARAAVPLALSWVPIIVLMASPRANHYFVHWPRLRVETFALVTAVTLATWEVGLLLELERSRHALTQASRRFGTASVLFVACLLTYLASGGGHLYTPDEWTIYAVAAGLVNHGVPAAYAEEPYPLRYMSRAAGELGGPANPEGVQQRVFTKYGALPSLLAAPAYALGERLGERVPLPSKAFPYENRALPLVSLAVNPIVTAAAAALVYLSSAELGYGRRSSIAAAAAFALGSLAWPFSKTLMNMTPAAASLVLGFYLSLKVNRGVANKRLAWTLAGVSVSLACAAATRYETLVLGAPTLALALGRAGPARRLGPALSLAAGLTAAALPLVIGMNVMRTGSPIATGYGGEGTLSTFSDKPWYGWLGMLFSPGCGLVPHTATIALGIVALILLWEDRPREALALGAAIALAIAYYGSLSTWCGYATWGPRYLLTVAPFMAIPLAALGSRIGGKAGNPFAWVVVGGLGAWSIATNLLAVSIDFNRGWQDHWANGLSYLQVTWFPYFTGVTTHWRLLRLWLVDDIGGLDLFWLDVHPIWGPLIEAALVAAALAATVTVWAASGSSLGAAQGGATGSDGIARRT